jgi:hypothetical protein
MNENHREIVEDLFSKVSMSMSESGKVIPVFALILGDGSVVPVMITDGQEFSMSDYASMAITAAHNMDAEALMLICEQAMISKKKNDPEIQAILNGSIKPLEHPDKEDFLCIIYMTANGETESLIAKIHTDLVGTRYTVDSKWVDYAASNLLAPWKGE